MDRQTSLEREAQCIQDQPPACTATCPVHVDVRGMVEKIRDGDLAGGLALFAATIPFPRTIARICDRPCQAACKRAELGESIAIGALERACVDEARLPDVKSWPGARKKKRVAVVGGGLSGLTAAVDLARKGYPVALFEASDRLGGRTRSYPEAALPGAAIDADLEALEVLGVELRLSAPVGGGGGAGGELDVLAEEYDAVYLGAGPSAGTFGLAAGEDGGIAIDPLTFATSHPRVFAGGGLRQGAGYSPITSLQDGRHAAVSIDRLLQDASLTLNRDRQGPFATRLFTSTRGVEPLPAVRAADPARGYAPAEAGEEARRCILCQCLECVKVCEYLAHYGAYPKRYVRQIFINSDLRLGNHTANRMINSCALCGLCEAVCPTDLSMGQVCREARQEMVEKGKMRPAAHDFALRDMAFSRGEHFARARHAPGHDRSGALF